MNKNRSFSGHKATTFSTPYQSNYAPYSTASCKKKHSSKVHPETTDWLQLFQQISQVTQKVKKLCNEDKKLSTRSRAKTKITKNIHFNKQEQYYPILKQNMILTAKKQQSTFHNLQMPCNSGCHALMKQCDKLTVQNKRLISQKQQLEKRLYYQSKQKRQLRWKFERQLEKQMYRYRKQLSHSFTLRLEKDSSHPTKYELSQSSYITAKKTSPLKQRDNNIIKLKQIPINSKQDDSLLIDFSIRGDEPICKKQPDQRKMNEITIQSVNLQKDLNELLEICKHESDRDKKKIIRKQMKQLAQKIRKLKNSC